MDLGTLVIGVAAILLVVVTVQLQRTQALIRRLERPSCDHCWHWVMALRSGAITYRHCCRCGILHATAIVEDTHTRAGVLHGPYMEHQSARDSK